MCIQIIGEQSEPPLDKLDGEIFIASRAVCLSLYIIIWCTYGLTTNTIPLALCAHTSHRGNQITIETESERERDCTKVYNRYENNSKFC